MLGIFELQRFAMWSSRSWMLLSLVNPFIVGVDKSFPLHDESLTQHFLWWVYIYINYHYYFYHHNYRYYYRSPLLIRLSAYTISASWIKMHSIMSDFRKIFVVKITISIGRNIQAIPEKCYFAVKNTQLRKSTLFRFIICCVKEELKM